MLELKVGTTTAQEGLSFQEKRYIAFFLFKRLGLEVVNSLGNPCTICVAGDFPRFQKQDSRYLVV